MTFARLPPTRLQPVLFAAAAASALVLGCRGSTPAALSAAPPPTLASADVSGVTALVDVSVLPMSADTLLEHQTVLVDKGTIQQIGPSTTVVVPPGAVRIDGAGKYVMPGMADMHVHLPGGADIAELQRVLDLSLAHGVTTIRGMQGAPGQLEARARLLAEHAAAPQLWLAGVPIDAPLRPSDARELARTTKSQGYDFIKVIGGIDRPAYAALVESAKEAGIPVCGHVPPEVGIDAALAAHQSSIEHVMGYAKAARESNEALDQLAQRTRAAGVANCPTLRFYATGSEPDVAQLTRREGMRYVSAAEQAAWVKERKENPVSPAPDPMKIPRAIVAALARAGAPLLVGSDSPGTFSVPGFAYLEELGELSRAGLAPYPLLRAATLGAAEYLHEEGAVGAVAVGQRADLVLLDGDPRASFDTLAHPAGVMLRGDWLPRRLLDEKLAAYARPSVSGVR